MAKEKQHVMEPSGPTSHIVEPTLLKAQNKLTTKLIQLYKKAHSGQWRRQTRREAERKKGKKGKKGMSSTQTYWCHECDMSIHLLTSTASGGDTRPPFCPHCQSDNLELMDDPTPPPTTTTTTTTDSNAFFLDSPSFRRFFLPFFSEFSTSDDDDTDTLFDFTLPTIKITSSLLEGIDDDPEVLCAVCKDQFVVDVDAKLLPCNHLFHPECILPWLNSNHNSCPLCRFQLPTPSKRDISGLESSSDFSFPQVRESAIVTDFTDNFSNVGVEIGFTHQDAVDCGFPDVGVLSNFLPSHF